MKHGHPHSKRPSHAKAVLIAKQAQGTLSKVISMMEQDEYCPDVIQQVDSVGGFLQSLKRELLAGHLDACVVEKMHENKEQTIKELLKIYNLTK
jgi:DNA-binding FrmR family transcriptional regulator